MTTINLNSILFNHQTEYAPIVPKEFLNKQPFIFDFTETNTELAKVDLTDIGAFTSYILTALEAAGVIMGAGGYGEDRVLYQKSGLFAGEGEPRSIHLAIDLWLPARTEIFAPLQGSVHSFQDNHNYLDYGPTIIIEHRLNGIKFYTLYGHLSKDSLEDLSIGKNIIKGERVACLGNSSENGQWPPHLHFQIISDMLGRTGDFPGVAKPSEKDYYLGLCPNPNLVLQIPNLP